MFGTGKKRGNRRLDRGFQLDVKLRTDVADRTRRRGVARILGRLLGVGLVAGAVAGGAALARHHWLHRVEALALRNVPVLTDGAISTNEIIGQAGLRSGLNTLAIDLPTVRERLMRHPRIASAEVRRELPGTLRLAIRERFPLARIKPPGRTDLDASYLLDETGHVMMPFRRNQVAAEVLEAESALPLVVGAPAVPFAVGHAVDNGQVRGALRFLAAFESSFMAGVEDVVSVDVSRPQELEVLTVFGSRINFGIRADDPAFSNQLRCWEAVHRDGVGRGRLIGTLDLSVTNNAPLRWLEASTPPPEGQRQSRPKRKPARRHV